jgi:hypothetical protein
MTVELSKTGKSTCRLTFMLCGTCTGNENTSREPELDQLVMGYRLYLFTILGVQLPFQVEAPARKTACIALIQG